MPHNEAEAPMGKPYNQDYWAIPQSQHSNIVGWGVPEGTKSDDGALMIMGLDSSVDLSALITSHTKPSWVTAPNWPRLSYEESRSMVIVKMTDDTITTGWWKEL